MGLLRFNLGIFSREQLHQQLNVVESIRPLIQLHKFAVAALSSLEAVERPSAVERSPTIQTRRLVALTQHSALVQHAPKRMF